jgi:hypothetical protein|tara:strand:+ start:2790 stop:2915 length:126 start_codon:yes stop_codon:yes gene_type:complete
MPSLGLEIALERAEDEANTFTVESPTWFIAVEVKTCPVVHC